MTENDESPGSLVARITYLEMTVPPQRRVAMPSGTRLAVMRIREMPLSFYRYLYGEVGRAHHWLLRRGMPDAELSAVIHSRHTAIHVLYAEGAPAGFFELDFMRLPDEAEIVYFGIIPDFQGRGLARFFLSEAIFSAWEKKPGRLVIHTNTLDNPRALQLYQWAGFSPYAYSEETVEPWS